MELTTLADLRNQVEMLKDYRAKFPWRHLAGPLKRAGEQDVAEAPYVLRQNSMTADLSDKETDEPFIADHRDFHKIEKWN